MNGASMSSVRGLAVFILAIVAALLSACSVEVTTGDGGGEARSGADAGSAGEELAALDVAQPGSMGGYSREKFDHWSDARENGWEAPDGTCDVRDAALIRDGSGVEVGSGCDVEAGEWRDPYTDRTYTDPSDIDIDHVVPLANAWRSGASAWDNAEREIYANAPEVLLSVEDNANQEKGDKGPEAWKPPNRVEWCDYAVRWIRIKSDYDLSANPQEKAALSEMLETCGGG